MISFVKINTFLEWILFFPRLPFLEERAKDYLSKTGETWSPLIVYKNGLHAKDTENVLAEEQNGMI